jgi:hypothetical protein
MSDFRGRIHQAPACLALDLVEAEHPLYRGAGPVLFTTAQGVISALVYVGNFDLDDEPRQAQAWVEARQAEGAEVWAGMASCWQICEPVPVPAGGDVRAWALMRLAAWA